MKLNVEEIQQALKISQGMQEDTFNVAVQVIHEDELHRFGSTEFVGWRHFLNLDFAVSINTYSNVLNHTHTILHNQLPFFL
jgi:hypothetical protein